MFPQVRWSVPWIFYFEACVIYLGSVQCCFTFTETEGLLGTGAQDVHLDFHTAPERKWPSRSNISNNVCLDRPHSGTVVKTTLVSFVNGSRQRLQVNQISLANRNQAPPIVVYQCCVMPAWVHVLGHSDPAPARLVFYESVWRRTASCGLKALGHGVKQKTINGEWFGVKSENGQRGGTKRLYGLTVRVLLPS